MEARVVEVSLGDAKRCGISRWASRATARDSLVTSGPWRWAVASTRRCATRASPELNRAADRGDQLRRSSESVMRNVAEGARRWSAQDAMKHYRIARAEAMESLASLDILLLASSIDQPTHVKAVAILKEVIAMLTKMSQPKKKRTST